VGKIFELATFNKNIFQIFESRLKILDPKFLGVGYATQIKPTFLKNCRFASVVVPHLLKVTEGRQHAAETRAINIMRGSSTEFVHAAVFIIFRRICSTALYPLQFHPSHLTSFFHQNSHKLELSIV
jgi:hypothetical protein